MLILTARRWWRKQKDETRQYIFKQIAHYFGLKANLLQGLKKMEIKIKVRYKSEFENLSIRTMDCYWYRTPGGLRYQWASSRLFIPRGDNVFPLCIWERTSICTMAANEGVTKAIASLFRDVSDTVFLGLSFDRRANNIFWRYKFWLA